MMGKIMRCSEVTQARFIRLSCLYWNKECELTYEDAEIEIDEEHLTILVKKKIVKHIEDKVVIEFLDEQMSNILETSDKRRQAAYQRWNTNKNRSKANGIQVHASALQTDADKIREDKDKSRKDEDEDIYTDIEILKSKYLSDGKICSAVIDNKKNRIENRAALEIYIQQFNEHLTQSGQHVKTWKDYTSHFLNWQRKGKDEITINRQTESTIRSNASGWES